MENYNNIEKHEDATYYYLNNDLHRIDGPAVEYNYGSGRWRKRCWYKNGKLHRIDGPAIEYSDGEKWWYQNGRLHRLDGSAIEYTDGYKQWYYEGKRIDCKSQEEFERYIKLKLFW
jgi:hypothetical protein